MSSKSGQACALITTVCSDTTKDTQKDTEFLDGDQGRWHMQEELWSYGGGLFRFDFRCGYLKQVEQVQGLTLN